MKPQHFLDTNILLYSISTAPEEQQKKTKAIDLLAMDRGALSIQVLQEFYVQATHATRSDRLPHDLAVQLIATWARFAVQDLNLTVFGRALAIKDRFGLSYWDSAIVAAALTLGCTTLYSEDMGHGQTFDGVAVVNPFL